jgi:hypothetical protein
MPKEPVARFKRTYALPTSAKVYIDTIKRDAKLASETEAVLRALEVAATCATRSAEEVRSALSITDALKRENLLSYHVALPGPARPGHRSGKASSQHREILVPIKDPS